MLSALRWGFAVTEVTTFSATSRLHLTLVSKQMRPGQPPDRIVRGFLLLPCHRLATKWSLQSGNAPALSSEKASLGQNELPTRHLAMTTVQPLRRPAALSLAPCLRSEELSNEQVWEEAATPGQPVALARVFWMIPRQFTLENRRLPLALPQSSGKHRNSHVSLNPLSATSLRLATEKTSLLVQKLWTMCLPCGSPRKTKN